MDGGSVAPAAPAETTTRAAQPRLLAFVTDSASEAALREGLAEALPDGFDIRRGSARTALTILANTPTPNALIIDISGESQPLALLSDLRHVVEPEVRVMIVGEREDLTFYREVTRNLGAAEYLYKPLATELVARHFGAHVRSGVSGNPADGGGRMLCVSATRGGAGATTVAVNLAWFLAEIGRRHTLMLDADLFTGTAAMLFSCQPGSGLRSAIEYPDRVDQLFTERVTVPISDRLHLLAAQEPLEERTSLRGGTTERLIMTLRRRFNFVVADVPFHGSELADDVAWQAQGRVLVLLPTLGSVRDAARILALPGSPSQVRRPVLVLNRTGMAGTLSRSVVEQSLGTKIDVCIPDLPKVVGTAETLGEPAAKARGAFRNAMSQLAREVASVAAGPLPSKRWWRR